MSLRDRFTKKTAGGLVVTEQALRDTAAVKERLGVGRGRKQPKYKKYRGADNPNNPHSKLDAKRGTDCKLVDGRWVPGNQYDVSLKLRGQFKSSRPSWVRFGRRRNPATPRPDGSPHTSVPHAKRRVSRNGNRVANRRATARKHKQERADFALYNKSKLIVARGKPKKRSVKV